MDSTSLTFVTEPPIKNIAVNGPPDVVIARREARAMAARIGFVEVAAEEIAIAVSELAENLSRYATRGSLTLKQIEDGDRLGIQIESNDFGPGIPNVEQALTDGFSTGRSQGRGLGSVARLMDQFDIESLAGGRPGTAIVCRNWLPRPSPTTDLPIDVGVTSRAKIGERLCGDAFVLERTGTSLLFAVIDGVGHGPPAHEAAKAARQFLQTHNEQPLEYLIQGVERVCRTTRGVVMGIGRLNTDTQTLQTCIVGNIEGRLRSADSWSRVFIRRGILGKRAPKGRTEEFSWAPTSCLVMHSDGLTARWKLEEVQDVLLMPAERMANEFVKRFGHDYDDATALVLKGIVL